MKHTVYHNTIYIRLIATTEVVARICERSIATITLEVLNGRKITYATLKSVKLLIKMNR